MLKNIPVKINADKSITANYPYKIYQGEINTVRFVIDPSLIISDTSDVIGYIGFKRSDNQKSGFLPLKREQNGTYTYVIKDYWTLNIANKVWYTIKFVSVDGENNLEYQLYAGNSSFPVNPLADYFIGDDIKPDASAILQEQIDINKTNINSKLNKDFTTYTKLEWDDVESTDIFALNRVNSDGSVSQYYAEAKDLHNTVNDIRPDDNGNIEITGQDISMSVDNNTSLSQEINNKVNVSSPVVYYTSDDSPYPFPMISVYSAERAFFDGDGNNIVNTYTTKQESVAHYEAIRSRITEVDEKVYNLGRAVSENYVNTYDFEVTLTDLKNKIPVLVSITESEYRDLAYKDPDTYYFIKEDD